MNVKELIQCLTKFPPEIPVVVDGYEDGFDNAVGAGTIRVALNTNSEWYYGRHGQSEEENSTEVVLIKGDRRTS